MNSFKWSKLKLHYIGKWPSFKMFRNSTMRLWYWKFCMHQLHAMKMIFSKVFLIWTFQDQNLAKNVTNLAENHKKKLEPVGFVWFAFSNSAFNQLELQAQLFSFNTTMLHLCVKQAQPKMCHSPKVEDGVPTKFVPSWTHIFGILLLRCLNCHIS